jgi:hypothetical protein
MQTFSTGKLPEIANSSMMAAAAMECKLSVIISQIEADDTL